MKTFERIFVLASLASVPILAATVHENCPYCPPATWNRTGVWDDDFIYCFRDGWVFPLGTNRLSDIAVWSQGSLFAKHTDWDPFASVGAPLLVIARRSHVSCDPTSSNSYLFAWENCFPNGDTNSPVSASIELFRNGDIVVTSNGVVRTTRHVNWFDADGDGIPDDADPDPQVPDPDGFTRWRTLPEGANDRNYCWIEIVSPHEDALVRFVGDAPADYPDPYFVAREGVTIRVPLLIGKEYEVESSCPVAIAGKSDPEIEVGIRDGGVTSVCWPVTVALGDSDPGGFSVSVSPSRLVGDYVWTNRCCRLYGGGRFFVYACDSSTCSCGGCRAEGYFIYEGYSPFYLLGGWCGCRPHEEHEEDTSCGISLPIPDTLFVDNDDDEDDGEGDYSTYSPLNDDIWEGRLRLNLDESSSGTVQIADLHCPGCDVYCGEGDDVTGLETGMVWRVVDRRFWSVPVRISAVSTIRGFEDCRIAVRWIPDVGVPLTEVVRFTAVSPVAEPVCSNVIHVVEADGAHDLVLNPSGIVVGKESVFRIGVRPVSYPDKKIVWHADGAGSVEFVGGGTGRVVRVRGVAPGDVELSAQIGDCQAARPRFFARVVTNMTVKLSAWIVERNGLIPRTVEDVRELVRQANDIYRQVGVTLDIGDRISITNIPQAYVINRYNEMTNRWNFARLVNTHSNTGGLECYFVGDIINDGTNKSYSVAGVHSPSGLVVSASCGDGVVLAHEIGHAFGMRDIFDENQATQAGVTGMACWIGSPSDWNGGCECMTGTPGAERYYPSGTSQCDIIRRMLMNGASEEGASGADITCGPVRGFDVDGELGLVGTGFFSGSQKVVPEHE